MELKNCKGSKSTNTILIYHQNICSVINKIDELYMHMQIDGIAPHLICLMEHHLKQTEINNLSLKGYKLASEFCRKKIRGGGACILINKALFYSTIDLNQYCHEKMLEMCTIKLHLKSFKLIVLCVYRAPTGDINFFLSNWK